MTMPLFLTKTKSCKTKQNNCSYVKICLRAARAMEQVELGINQISEVVQSNSAAAEETSATSEELSAQAETLETLVANFQLRSKK